MHPEKRIIIFTTKLLVILLVLAIFPAAALAAQQVVVKGSSVHIRSGPGTTYKVTGSAGQGDKFSLLDKSGQWYKVKLTNGSTGWIAGWLADLKGSVSTAVQPQSPAKTAAPEKMQALVTGSVLNVRTGPGTVYPVAAKMKQGTALEVLGKSGDWYKVRISGTTTGWVAGWLVTIKQGVPAQPKTQPAQPAPSGKSQAEVTGSVVNVRSGPGTGFKATGKIYRGARLTVLDKSGDWYKLQTPSGQGWVYGNLLKVTAPASQPVTSTPSGPNQVPDTGNHLAVINGNLVNVRSGPGTGFDVVTKANLGDKLPLIDKSADWYKVKLPDGKTGWVVAWLTRVEDSGPSRGESPSRTDENSGVEMPAGGVVPPQQNQGPQTPAGNSGATSGNDGANAIIPGSSGGQGENNTPATAVNDEIKLKSLTVREDGRGTGVTVESRSPIKKISILKLSSPHRLVVDLEGVQPGDLPGTVNAGTRLVSQVRVGWYNSNPDTVRLVFDLSGICHHTAVLSDDKTSLRLEIFPPGPGRPLAGSTVVIDPGHGGADPGAIGSTGLREKDVNLDVARRVAQYLRNQGANVILTREDDIYLELDQRPAAANNSGAAVFVSIHMNANPSSAYGGSSTYYLRSAGEGGEYLVDEGKTLAGYIQDRLVSDLGLRDIGELQANFAVLRHSQVPASLVEVAFISNPREEELMKTEIFKDNAARAIARGIADFFAGGTTSSIQ